MENGVYSHRTGKGRSNTGGPFAFDIFVQKEKGGLKQAGAQTSGTSAVRSASRLSGGNPFCLDVFWAIPHTSDA